MLVSTFCFLSEETSLLLVIIYIYIYLIYKGKQYEERRKRRLYVIAKMHGYGYGYGCGETMFLEKLGVRYVGDMCINYLLNISFIYC